MFSKELMFGLRRALEIRTQRVAGRAAPMTSLKKIEAFGVCSDVLFFGWASEFSL